MPSKKDVKKLEITLAAIVVIIWILFSGLLSDIIIAFLGFFGWLKYPSLIEFLIMLGCYKYAVHLIENIKINPSNWQEKVTFGIRKKLDKKRAKKLEEMKDQFKVSTMLRDHFKRHELIRYITIGVVIFFVLKWAMIVLARMLNLE